MAYVKAGDGRVIKRGKTKVNVYPTDGPHVVDTGPKKYTSNLNFNMKKMGINLARANNQKAGSK